MEGLNGNLDWQFFCGIYLGTERLANFKIISEIRTYLSKKLDMDKVQQAFYGHWSPYMEDRHSIVMDATCYESHLRSHQRKTPMGVRGLAPRPDEGYLQGARRPRSP